MKFLRRMDRIVEMFEGLMRLEDAHIATSKRPAFVAIGVNPPEVRTRRPKFEVVHQIEDASATSTRTVGAEDLSRDINIFCMFRGVG